MVVITIALASVVAAVVLSFDDQLTSPDWDSETDNPWAEDALFGPENPVAGATDVRYRVFVEIDEELDGRVPLQHLTINVDNVSGDMFTGTENNDLEAFLIHRTNGSVVDLGSASKWEADDNELTIGNPPTTKHLEKEGEIVEIIFDGVDNPAESGSYEVTVSINQGNITEQKGDLEIVPA